MRYVAKKSNSAEIFLLVGALFLAAIFGVLSALGGGSLALLLFAPILPIIFILRDFRVGVFFLIFLLPFQHTPFLPSFTGFNMVNYITFTTFFSLWSSHYFLKMPLAPFPRIFFWAYLLPIFFAAINGLFHLDEVPKMWITVLGAVYLGIKPYLSGLVIKPLFIVLTAWMLSTAAINSKKTERFIGAVLFSPVLPAMAIIVFVMLSGFNLTILASERSRGVLSKLGMHANEFGLLLSTSFTLLLFVIPAIQSVLVRVGALFSLAIIAMALLLTFSRGGYIVAVLALMSFAIVHKKLRYILVLLFVLLVFGAFAPDAFWQRITTGMDEGGTTSRTVATSTDGLTAGRVWLWQQLLPEFWKSPLWGAGVGSVAWSDTVKKGTVLANHPHNLYLRILLDIGIIGMTLFSLFIVFLFKNLKKVANDPKTPLMFAALARGARVTLLGILLSGWANGRYIPDSELAIFWMAVGLLLPFLNEQHLASLKLKKIEK